MAAALDNDSAAFLAAVRRDAFLATADDNWTDSRILSIADDCTLAICAPALKRAKQGWFRLDFNIAMVAEQPRYDVPEEAMWSSIEAAWLIDPTTGQIQNKINMVDVSNRMQYGFDNPGVPQYAWFDHTQLVFAPSPDTNTVGASSMTCSAYRRPAQIVLTSETCRVTAVDTVSQSITVTTRPTAWTTDTYTGGTPYRLDFYDRDLPNTRLLWNQTCSAPNTTQFQFAPLIDADDFASISVGDVVTMKGTSPYPDLPPEAVPFLRKMVQKTILTAQTDAAALQIYLAEQGQAMELFFKGMGNRSDGSARKLSMANAAAARFTRGYGPRYRR